MDSNTSTTFRVSNTTPEKHQFHNQPKNVPHKEQITKLKHYQENACTEILQMTNFPENVYFSNNGFVNTVLDAYNLHHNLIIRPDDVWGAIMTQFSFYINKHAEDFRKKFVNFDGKKQLVVAMGGSLRSASYDTFVKLMSKEIDRNLVDPEVKKWILPSFSTTTDNDLVTIGVVFMATMKKYFDYMRMLMCGIPSVTLEGTLDDWKDVYQRLEKLKEYKLEKWYDMLEPILSEFVNAKQGTVDLDFWQKIAHYEGGGSGPRYISGWITAFCAFDTDGNFCEANHIPEFFKQKQFTDAKMMKYVRLATGSIPYGVVEVDVVISDNGAMHNSVMFAGHVATEVKDDGTTVQPTLGWAIALKPPPSKSGDTTKTKNKLLKRLIPKRFQ